MRWIKLIKLFCVCTTFYFGSTYSIETNNENSQGRCHITVKLTRKSEETSEQVFSLNVKTKEACLKAAKVHETNFNPSVIEKVSVSTIWDE